MSSVPRNVKENTRVLKCAARNEEKPRAYEILVVGKFGYTESLKVKKKRCVHCSRSKEF